jgi:hypothetical protein
MNLQEEYQYRKLQNRTRRHFLRTSMGGLGALALGSLLGCGPEKGKGRGETGPLLENPMAASVSHYTAKAKRVIYLHMAGGPSQLELFDYKPALQKLDGKACPDSLLEGKRFAFIQGVPEMLGPQAQFRQHGQSGTWVSDNLPYFQGVVDEVTLLKAMHTDEFNHAPAQLLLHTGSARLGRPGMGSWVSYGLGSENENLPGFIVLVSGGNTPSGGKSLWGSGFLPSVYQGVQCRTQGDPVLYLSDPSFMNRQMKRRTIDAINQLNEEAYSQIGSPEIMSRVAQYEMAYQMQASVPEVMDISREPDYIHEMYGTQPGQTSFANNCLLARRLVEKGVRFVQLYDWGWDTHGTSAKGGLNEGFKDKCQDVDQAMSALLTDLKQRGLLDETLVVWGGEFGRTPMQENRAGADLPYAGRDHHRDAFTMWMAGGGVKSGFSYGETDELGYDGVAGRTHVHDLQATILHLLGMDHERLTYKFQGRDFRLTDVHGHIIQDILA